MVQNEIIASHTTNPKEGDSREATREYSLINLLRFLAAMWVLLFHAHLHFGDISSLRLLLPFIEQGVLAMSLFFILSGFILSSRYSVFLDRESLMNFYIARFSRLYPVYFIMGALTVWTLFGQMGDYVLGDGETLKGILWILIVVVMFVTATQAWFPSLFSVWNFGGSWSLSVEAFFYALFPVLRAHLDNLSNKVLFGIVLGIPLLAIAMAAGLQASRTNQDDMGIIFYSIPIYRFPEFILGISGFILFKSRNYPINNFLIFSSLLLVIGLLSMFIVGDIAGNIEYGGFFMGIFICIIFGCAHQRITNPHVERFFDWLGHISYCLYLVQFGTVPIFKILLAGHSVELKWFNFVMVNFLFAVLMFYTIETPLRRPVRGLLRHIAGRRRLGALA